MDPTSPFAAPSGGGQMISMDEEMMEFSDFLVKSLSGNDTDPLFALLADVRTGSGSPWAGNQGSNGGGPQRFAGDGGGGASGGQQSMGGGQQSMGGGHLASDGGVRTDYRLRADDWLPQGNGFNGAGFFGGGAVAVGVSGGGVGMGTRLDGSSSWSRIEPQFSIHAPHPALLHGDVADMDADGEFEGDGPGDIEPGAFGDDEAAMMKNRLTHMAQREEELLRHVSWLEQRLREAGGDPGAYASEAFARQNEIIDDLKRNVIEHADEDELVANLERLAICQQATMESSFTKQVFSSFNQTIDELERSWQSKQDTGASNGFGQQGGNSRGVHIAPEILGADHLGPTEGGGSNGGGNGGNGGSVVGGGSARHSQGSSGAHSGAGENAEDAEVLPHVIIGELGLDDNQHGMVEYLREIHRRRLQWILTERDFICDAIKTLLRQSLPAYRDLKNTVPSVSEVYESIPKLAVIAHKLTLLRQNFQNESLLIDSTVADFSRVLTPIQRAAWEILRAHHSNDRLAIFNLLWNIS